MRTTTPARRSGTFAAIALLVASLLLSACGDDSGSDEAEAGDGLTLVKLSSAPLSHLAPIRVGIAQGFFADQGIKLEIDDSVTSVTVPDVVSGKVDISTGDMTSILTAKSKGLDLKAIVPASASTNKAGADFGALVVGKDSPITSAAQLEGKNVSTNILTNVASAALRESVTAAGGDSTKVKLVELPFPDAPAALAAGKTDGAWLVEPFLSLAIANGAKPIGWGFTDLAENLTVSAWFTSGPFLKKNPEIVEGFKTAVQQSFAYARDHEDEIRAEIPKFTEIPPAVAEKITLTAWADEINRDSLVKLVEYGKRDGIITDDPNLDELLLK